MAKPRFTMSNNVFHMDEVCEISPLTHIVVGAVHRRLSITLLSLYESLAMVKWDHENVIHYRELTSFSPFDNPYRARYIHLYNLWTLFAFVIPAIQDYGILWKLDFMAKYLQLFL